MRAVEDIDICRVGAVSARKPEQGTGTESAEREARQRSSVPRPQGHRKTAVTRVFLEEGSGLYGRVRLFVLTRRRRVLL